MKIDSRGGTGLSPTRARARPSRFFEVFRVPEPEVFESGLARLGPSPREKPAGTRGYPKVIFYKALYVTKCFAAKKKSRNLTPNLVCTLLGDRTIHHGLSFKARC